LRPVVILRKVVHGTVPARVWRTTASCAACLKPPADKAKRPTTSSWTSSPKTRRRHRSPFTAIRSPKNPHLRSGAEPLPLLNHPPCIALKYELNCYAVIVNYCDVTPMLYFLSSFPAYGMAVILNFNAKHRPLYRPPPPYRTTKS
jgi:hypothetical protein